MLKKTRRRSRVLQVADHTLSARGTSSLTLEGRHSKRRRVHSFLFSLALTPIHKGVGDLGQAKLQLIGLVSS